MEPLISANEYQKSCSRTESMNFPEILCRIMGLPRLLSEDVMDHFERDPSFSKIRLLHGIIGIITESGEISDNVKKHLFYGKDLDKENLIEELGDILWYVATSCNAIGIPLDEVMFLNIEKLKLRYPEQFTEEDALDRKDKTCEQCGQRNDNEGGMRMIDTCILEGCPMTEPQED